MIFLNDHSCDIEYFFSSFIKLFNSLYENIATYATYACTAINKMNKAD